jgi:hypothetical protein
MGKRGGELKSTPLPVQVARYKCMDTIRPRMSTYWGVDHSQPFFPSLETLFKVEAVTDGWCEYGIKLDTPIQSINSPTEVTTVHGTSIPVHIKQTSILNVLKWMRGDYGTSLGLPTTQQEAMTIHDKLQTPHNAAYVGGLLSAILSQTKCVHFPQVYGVFSGIAQKHTVDISDDYCDLMERPWFSKQIGKTFELKLTDHIEDGGETFQHTRNARSRMDLGDEIELGDVEEIDGIASSEQDIPMMEPHVLDECDNEEDTDDDTSTVSTSCIFEIDSCNCSETGDMSDQEDDDEDEGFAWATVSNVPVQLTVMERCEGTLYQLMSLNSDSQKHWAWIAQIVFALAFAQRTLAFVHNDLHSNNIMYVQTDKQHLWYKVDGEVYKVPTYGYILKIIDFERGTGSVRVAGMKHPKIFTSDHFSLHEEAAGQYNTDPFHTSKVEPIKPNPSFDLVRLATSLFWDLFPEGPTCTEYAENPVFKLLIKWLTVEDGTSIMFGKKNARHDRYHGFELYKAIARYCKDTAVPRKEISVFQEFRIQNAPGTIQYDIHL